MPGKFHEQKSLAGYSPQGCKRVRRDWATEHAEDNSMKIGNTGLDQNIDDSEAMELDKITKEKREGEKEKWPIIEP